MAGCIARGNWAVSADPLANRPAPNSRWAVFVRAARPFGLWVCVTAFALQVVVLPLVAIFAAAAAPLISPEIAKLAFEGLVVLGGLRSIDKALGKAT